MRITMIGAGYVGLVSGACFADFGHQVCCIDRDPEKLAMLKGGKIPIYEPGLEELVTTNALQGRLRFDDNLADAVSQSDVVFIAVGTPSRRGDGFADLSYVYDAAAEVGRALKGFTVVVTKSTVPVGTGDEVERIIREQIQRPILRWSPIRNFFARDRRSTISSDLIASLSGPTPQGPRQ